MLFVLFFKSFKHTHAFKTLAEGAMLASCTSADGQIDAAQLHSGALNSVQV